MMRLQLKPAMAAFGMALLFGWPAYAASDVPADSTGSGVTADDPADADTGTNSGQQKAGPGWGAVGKSAGAPAAPVGNAPASAPSAAPTQTTAAAPAGSLKSELDGFLGSLASRTNGVVTWDGSDPYQAQRQGDTEVAVIPNGKLSIHAQDTVIGIALDRIELRRKPDAADSSLADIEYVLPAKITLTGPNAQITLAVKDGKGSAVVERVSGRAHSSSLSFASARAEHTATGSWINFGPLSVASKLVPGANGAWTAPADFELGKVEFFSPQGPVGGTIDRIAYTARSAGPHIADINKLRDRLDAMRSQQPCQGEACGAQLLAIMKDMPMVFGMLQGELSVEGIAVRVATGEALFSLAKASMGVGLTGLDADAAAFRLTIKHEGLALAAMLLDPTKVPKRVIVDFGIENLSTAALRNILEAATKMAPGADDQQKQAAQQQMMGSAAMLNPTFRIYDVAFETPQVAVDLTGEAKGSPLSPNGYVAGADMLVTGFDAIPALAGPDAPAIQYLPLLKELGEPVKGNAGAPQLKYHLASSPGKWITINGNDVSPWLSGEAEPGQPRVLKPAEPPMQGPDVAGVQRALTAAQFPVEADGIYGPPTAVAVARYQHQNGMNVNGVVDAATFQKLGVKADAAAQPTTPGPGAPPAAPPAPPAR